MKIVILDTSFILTCVKQKIDFLEELTFMGFHVVIPIQVTNELEGLSETNSGANLALKILSSVGFEKIDLKQKNVDNSIINYAKKHPEVILATLDQEIKNRTKNRKIVIRGRKKLEVI